MELFAPVFRKVREHDMRTVGNGQLFFGLLRSISDALHSGEISGKIYLVLVFKTTEEPLGDAFVKIITAQVVVSGSSQYLDDAFANLDHRNIEGTAA